MKLFTRYFRINLLATVLIFVLASMAFYSLLWYVSIRQVDEDLRIEQREIETYVSKYGRAPEPVNVKDQTISNEISPVHETVRKFSTVRSPNHRERENFRQIQFTIPVNDRWLMFTVSKVAGSDGKHEQGNYFYFPDHNYYDFAGESPDQPLAAS